MSRAGQSGTRAFDAMEREGKEFVRVLDAIERNTAETVRAIDRTGQTSDRAEGRRRRTLAAP